MVRPDKMSNESSPLIGKFLIAMPSMSDSRFEKSVIYICAHSADGAMGFIINQTLDTPNVPDFLNKLQIIRPEETKNIPPEIVNHGMHMGGPVEPGRGFVLHTPEFKSDTTAIIGDGVCLTATLEILRSIAVGKGPQKSIIALGYSGWSSGQLESEISANGWLTCDADEAIIFDAQNSTKYNRSLALLGIDPVLLSRDAGHA